MKTMLNLFLVSLLTLSFGTAVAATSKEQSNSVKNERAVKTLNKSASALENVLNDPKNGIPQSLLDKSEGIVIFPRALKVAVGAVGGQGGRGIAMIRKEDGSWSNPFFVTLGEGSFGLQIGVQSTEFVLLFKDRDDVMKIDNAGITLGTDIGAAAGPADCGSSATTDLKFDSEIYSYYRSKGLFAGVSLKGGVLTYNNKVSDALYGIDFVDTDEIFNEIETPYNDKVNDLIQELNAHIE